MRTFIAAAVAAIASAEIVRDEAPLEDHCCKFYAAKGFMIDTEDDSETQANMHSTLEVCLNKSWLLDTYIPTAESFRGRGGDVNASYFNDTMESYKCGKNAAANVCDVIYSAKSIPDEVNGG